MTEISRYPTKRKGKIVALFLKQEGMSTIEYVGLSAVVLAIILALYTVLAGTGGVRMGEAISDALASMAFSVEPDARQVSSIPDIEVSEFEDATSSGLSVGIFSFIEGVWGGLSNSLTDEDDHTEHNFFDHTIGFLRGVGEGAVEVVTGIAEFGSDVVSFVNPFDDLSAGDVVNKYTEVFKQGFKVVKEESSYVLHDVVNIFKDGVKHIVCEVAEVFHKVYKVAADTVERYPRILDFSNKVIDRLAPKAELFTDMDPETMEWSDLLSIWLFELGSWPGNTIEFDAEAATTKDLMDEEGVLQAREMALEAIAEGDIDQIVDGSWEYNIPQFWDGLRNGNMTTSFLGSYNATIQIVDNGDDTYTLNYEVVNVSSWESGTRLRWDKESIIPSRQRGDSGSHLGGNITEIWRWSEIVPQEEIK